MGTSDGLLGKSILVYSSRYSLMLYIERYRGDFYVFGVILVLYISLTSPSINMRDIMIRKVFQSSGLKCEGC